MEDERDSADIPRSAGSDPGCGSRSGFKLSAKLRMRIEKLKKWRISPSSIKAPKDAHQFHGGHAIVSKAFLLDDDEENWWKDSYDPREVLQLCRQSPGSDDHIRRATVDRRYAWWAEHSNLGLREAFDAFDDHGRGAADNRRDAEGELGDEEKDDEQEYGFDRHSRWGGKFVAVKKSRIGDNKDLERVLGLALRETEFLAELFHKSIVVLKGFIEDLSNDIIWLVFPWAENGNLKDFVASQDWAIPERISLINDVAQGLEYLHSQEPPICHGDLKSFNILVDSLRRAKITDFGSARRITEHDLNRQPGLVQTPQQPVQAKLSTLSKTITLTGNIYTLRWAAPELLNDDQMTLWSDIWALGWIAYEVLTNFIPFQDVPKDAAVIERVIKGDLPSLNEHTGVSLFQDLCSLMTMCWKPNPSDRPTAKDYVRALSDIPMVVPDGNNEPYLRLSSKLSSEVMMRRGGEGRDSGDLAMAFACFTEAHRIYTMIGDRGGEANAGSCLAELHLNREEYSEAIAHYSESLQIYTDIFNMEGRTSALWGLAEVHQRRYESDQAITLRASGLQICTDIDDRRGRADALWRLAEVHRLQNKYSKAIALYSEALQIRIDIGDRMGQASALSGLAGVHRLRNECSEAIKLYSKALQIRPDIDDSRARAFTLWSLAEVHRLRHEYSDAIAHYSELLQIWTDIGDRQCRASALWGLAEVHRVRNEHSEAIALYSEAQQIRNDIDDRQGRADALWGLAEVHRLREQYSEAVEFYNKVLQIRTDSGDRKGRASALWGLAEVHRFRKEHSEAIALYTEVLQIHANSGDRKARADALWGLAEVHRLREQYSKANALYSEVLKIRTDVGDTKCRADALSALADIHRHQDHHDDPASLDEQAAELFEQFGHDDAAAYALKKAAHTRQRIKPVEAA